MVIFYKKWKKYNAFQLQQKKEMDLNNLKMKNHPPSHGSRLVTFELRKNSKISKRPR